MIKKQKAQLKESVKELTAKLEKSEQNLKDEILKAQEIRMQDHKTQIELIQKSTQNEEMNKLIAQSVQISESKT